MCDVESDVDQERPWRRLPWLHQTGERVSNERKQIIESNALKLRFSSQVHGVDKIIEVCRAVEAF